MDEAYQIDCICSIYFFEECRKYFFFQQLQQKKNQKDVFE